MRWLHIHLSWVPGHRDIEGNCKEDELARICTTTDILVDEDTISIPLATCKMRINQNMIKFAQLIWNNNPTCRISKFTWPVHMASEQKTFYDETYVNYPH